MKAYIVVLSTFHKDFDIAAFHKKLTEASDLIAWWHYIPNAYIIIVNNTVDANSITNFILQIAPNQEFITIKTDINDHNGWMPKEAWDWINKQVSLLKNK
jgi:hypothetical protein